MLLGVRVLMNGVGAVSAPALLRSTTSVANLSHNRWYDECDQSEASEDLLTMPIVPRLEVSYFAK